MRLSLFSLLFFSEKIFSACVGLACTCSISATNVSFGTYDPLSVVPIKTNASVAVNCSALVLNGLVAYEIDLSEGNGTYAQRKMMNATYALNYNLYTDATLTVPWGDGSNGSGTVSDNYLLAVSPSIRNYTIYAEMPAQQTAPPGTYSDTIIATVTF